MLKMIDEVLLDLINTTSIQIEHISSYVNKLINVMEDGISYTSLELMNKLGLKSRISFRKNYLDPSIEN